MALAAMTQGLDEVRAAVPRRVLPGIGLQGPLGTNRSFQARTR